MLIAISARFIALAAVSAICAPAGVVHGPAPIYKSPLRAWIPRLTSVLHDPALAGLLPLPIDVWLGQSQALRAASPLVWHLEQSLSLTPDEFELLPVPEKKSALELASKAAREELSMTVYELAESARRLSMPGKSLDREARAELYETLTRLSEARDHYGVWLGESEIISLEDSYQRSSTRAWQERTLLLQKAQGALGTNNAESIAAQPVLNFQPSRAALNLRARLEGTTRGWNPKDLNSLYAGYGFVARNGANHVFYQHPAFPELHTAIPYSAKDLPLGYAQSALKLIAELERLVAAPQAEAPGSGVPKEFNLQDLEPLFFPPVPEPVQVPVLKKAIPVTRPDKRTPKIPQLTLPPKQTVAVTKPSPPPVVAVARPQTWTEWVRALLESVLKKITSSSRGG